MLLVGKVKEGNVDYTTYNFYETFNVGAIRCRDEKPPQRIEKDCRLQRTVVGDFFLNVPFPAASKQDSPHPPPLQTRILALDPGVRTFMTGYDPAGSLFEFGAGDIGRVTRLCSYLDKLQSKHDLTMGDKLKRFISVLCSFFFL